MFSETQTIMTIEYEGNLMPVFLANNTSITYTNRCIALLVRVNSVIHTVGRRDEMNIN